MKRILKFLPILCVMILWGSMGIPSTYALSELNPFALLCLRSGIGALTLFPFAWKAQRYAIPERSEWPLILLLSVIGVVLCNFFYFFALSRTSLMNVAILYASGPLITALLAVVFLKEKIGVGRGVGIIIAFSGVVLLLTKGEILQLFSIQMNGGDIAEFASACCLAVYTVLSKRLKKTAIECATFWMMVCAFLISFPLGFIFERAVILKMNLRTVLSVLYLGVFCSGVGYLLQQISIRRVGAASTAAFLNGISPVTVLTAWMFLNEKISTVQICSMLLVFIGLYLNASNWTFSQLRHIMNVKTGKI